MRMGCPKSLPLGEGAPKGRMRGTPKGLRGTESFRHGLRPCHLPLTREAADGETDSHVAALLGMTKPDAYSNSRLSGGCFFVSISPVTSPRQPCRRDVQPRRGQVQQDQAA